MEELAEQVRSGLERKLRSYGKLGLLIEDATDGALRTAREIYGADGLPDWWLWCKDLESGASGLRAACDQVFVQADGTASFPLVVILDLFLKSRTVSRAVAWDAVSPDDSVASYCKSIQKDVRRLQSYVQSDGPKRISCLTVTSFLTSRDEGHLADVDWQPRHHEPLFRLRQLLADEFLSFGPVESMKSPLLSGVLEVNACRQRFWHDTLEELSEALRQPDSRSAKILFTGAGASLRNDELAPGMPATWELLDQVAESFKGSIPRKVPEKGKRLENLSDLISLVNADGSTAERTWTLERLFERHSNPKPLLEAFVEKFRNALQRADQGFPYHTWLLAQLPWTAILTSNFDGFHERAAASAASQTSGEASRRYRRLGDIASIPSTQPQELLEGAGLFKPYGSLTSIHPLALTDKDFWDKVKGVGNVLESILKKMDRDRAGEYWLIFLGQRLASELLTKKVIDLLEEGESYSIRFHLVWVDPACCDLDSHPNGGSRLIKDFARAMNGEPVVSPNCDFHLLPARALDFAYDLSYRYHWSTSLAAPREGR